MKNRGLVDYIEVQDLAQWKAIEYLTIDSVNDRLINMFGEDTFHKDELFFVKKEKGTSVKVKIVKYTFKDDNLFIIDGDIYTQYTLDEIKKVNYSEDCISFFCNKDFNYEFKIDKIIYKQKEIQRSQNDKNNINNKDGWEYRNCYRNFTEDGMEWEDFWKIKCLQLHLKYDDKLAKLNKQLLDELLVDIKLKNIL